MVRTPLWVVVLWTFVGFNAEATTEPEDPAIPALVPGTLGATIYRLGRYSLIGNIVVRIEKKPGQAAQLVVKKFHQGVAPEISIFELPEQRWQALERELHESSFWLEPTEFEKRGLDGETLILEVLRDDGRYHKVRRWSPHVGRFLRLCRFIGRLGKPEDSLPGDHKVDPRSADSETFGSLFVQARNSQGQPLKVHAQLQGAGIEDARMSDASGNFSFDRIVPGYYTLSLKTFHRDRRTVFLSAHSGRHVRVEAGMQRCFRLLGTQATEDHLDGDHGWTLSSGCPKADNAHGPK